MSFKCGDEVRFKDGSGLGKIVAVLRFDNGIKYDPPLYVVELDSVHCRAFHYELEPVEPARPELHEGDRVRVTVEGIVKRSPSGALYVTSDNATGGTLLTPGQLDAAAAVEVVERTKREPAWWPPQYGDVAQTVPNSVCIFDGEHWRSSGGAHSYRKPQILLVRDGQPYMGPQ